MLIGYNLARKRGLGRKIFLAIAAPINPLRMLALRARRIGGIAPVGL
jgi:hypothetical protein